jgi:putative membrane protein
MNNKAAHEPPATQPEPRVQLASERTFLAYGRTRIAWVRTALALISFGFAIAKFFQYLREKRGETATTFGPRAVGLVMITIGLVGLILAHLQERRALKCLRRRCPRTTGTHLRCNGGIDRVSRHPGSGGRHFAIAIEFVCA